VKLLILILCGWAIPFNVVAEERSETSTQRLEDLEARIRALETNRVSDANRVPASLQRDAKTDREEPTAKDVKVSGIIEVGFTLQRDYNKDSTSDITNDTAQIDIEKRISDIVSGRITLLHEDSGEKDDGGIAVDEAVLTLGKEIGLYLHAGKMYVPFGNFDSEFVSDPTTLEIGETNENAVLVGYRWEHLSVSAYGFNGDSQKDGQENKVNGMGANIAAEFGRGPHKFKSSLGYINNLADTDGMNSVDIFADKNSDASVNDLVHQVSGLSVGLDYDSSFMLAHAEWITALEAYDPTDLNWNGKGARVGAYKLELGSKHNILEKETMFLLGYQSTRQLLKAGLAKDRWMGGVKIQALENLQLSYEFKYETDYSTMECSSGVCGTGGFATAHSLLLSVEF
jgi:hypothetical protein